MERSFEEVGRESLSSDEKAGVKSVNVTKGVVIFRKGKNIELKIIEIKVKTNRVSLSLDSVQVQGYIKAIEGFEFGSVYDRKAKIIAWEEEVKNSRLWIESVKVRKKTKELN